MPSNLLYIDPNMTPSQLASPAITPTGIDQSDKLAVAGAELKRTDDIAKSVGDLAIADTSAPQKQERTGVIGQAQTPLPDVHAEAEDYYGKTHIHSRARTFSTVSRTWCVVMLILADGYSGVHETSTRGSRW